MAFEFSIEFTVFNSRTFCFILLIHKIQIVLHLPQIKCQELFSSQVPYTPAYTAQLLTLYQHRANNHFVTTNQI